MMYKIILMLLFLVMMIHKSMLSKVLTYSMEESDDIWNAEKSNDESHHDEYNYGKKMMN